MLAVRPLITNLIPLILHLENLGSHTNLTVFPEWED